jgi:hypothetical protein
MNAAAVRGISRATMQIQLGNSGLSVPSGDGRIFQTSSLLGGSCQPVEVVVSRFDPKTGLKHSQAMVNTVSAPYFFILMIMVSMLPSMNFMNS